jgi:ABC-2 type transport system permease protein
MRNIWILFKREMMAYFFSPIAYIVSVSLLLSWGASFLILIDVLKENPQSDFSITTFMFNGMFMWIVIIGIVSVITMRLFADEKRSGTIEALMTTPLRDIEYVLAKFFSAYVFFVLLWLPTANCIFVLRYFSKDTTPLDLGSIVGGYLGFFLIGMLLISIGSVASACTRNQIIAAVISFSANCILFFLGILIFYAADKHRAILESFSMIAHMQEMSTGLIQWPRVVFYLSTSIFFLFVTQHIVQSRRWRS